MEIRDSGSDYGASCVPPRTTMESKGRHVPKEGTSASDRLCGIYGRDNVELPLLIEIQLDNLVLYFVHGVSPETTLNERLSRLFFGATGHRDASRTSAKLNKR
ncbi:hypothetical protein T265_02124 [Opisthorchis viverrini]|uniref:Uncharacterized protein n=1 Tax=Opisthorchis viverrini TaxID=6198 RepID=A0A075AIJ9_OPIVI|nr:hypothetical protein T265_02124 [Opisthorchis viverrini]KER31764.1 hypothetical protein T265_02124 [Opisthorchis viverrini]